MSLPSSLCLSHNRVQFSRGAVKDRRKKKKKPIQVGTVSWGLGSSLATDLKQSKEWEAQHKGKPWDLISSLGRNLAREPLLSVCADMKKQATGRSSSAKSISYPCRHLIPWGESAPSEDQPHRDSLGVKCALWSHCSCLSSWQEPELWS